MLKNIPQKILIFLIVVGLAPGLCMADAAVTQKFTAKVESMFVISSSDYEYENVSDGEVSKADYSAIDMFTKAVLGGVLGVEKNGWEAVVKLNLDIKTDSTITPRDKNITLKRDKYSITYGTQYHWGVNVGNKYLTDEIGDIMWVGEIIAARDDYIDVGLDFSKEYNTTFNVIVGENIKEESALPNGANRYKKTVLGLIVKNDLDDIQIKASYMRVNTVVDSGLESSASRGSVVDGKAQTSMALGVGYKVTPKVSIALNADFIRKKDGGSYSYDPKLNAERGNIASDVINEQVMVFILDVDLDDESGFSFAYNKRSEKLSESNDSPLEEDRVILGYRTQLAQVNVYAQYYQTHLRDKDADPSNTRKYQNRFDSQLGVGLAYTF